MKIKFLIILLCGCFTLTTFSVSAQTEEQLEFEESTNEGSGPLSMGPSISGVLSYVNNEICINFRFITGTVTTQIVRSNGELFGSYSQIISFEGSQTIDIANLPAGNYQIICYVPNRTKRFIANFSL
ncbi:hypothetical protein LJC12_03310 [Odoribacter sp. OttesenSCG-928-J03]|nr:hypothetical protein [Odoribacter sp. OttesenSCG-928-J03]MDL2330547.1 hypothetical protein [Odoribacter sp. OttesenSCG-928-A06]